MSWHPNWSDEACAIIGAGPSAVAADLSKIRGRFRVIAVNRSFQLAPWADMLYACDGRFWREVHSAHKFRGLKVCAEDVPGTHCVKICSEDGRYSRQLQFAVTGEIGGGYNSGFQALNLAVQFGCKSILLIGFDASVKHGAHWHGDHKLPLTNPSPSLCKAWAKTLDDAADTLAERGVRVAVADTSAAQRYPTTTVHKWAHDNQ